MPSISITAPALCPDNSIHFDNRGLRGGNRKGNRTGAFQCGREPVPDLLSVADAVYHVREPIARNCATVGACEFKPPSMVMI